MLEMHHYFCTCDTLTINISKSFVKFLNYSDPFYYSLVILFKGENVRMMKHKWSNLQQNFSFIRPKSQRFKIHDAEQQIFLHIDFPLFLTLKKLYSLSREPKIQSVREVQRNPTIFHLSSALLRKFNSEFWYAILIQSATMQLQCFIFSSQKIWFS